MKKKIGAGTIADAMTTCRGLEQGECGATRVHFDDYLKDPMRVRFLSGPRLQVFARECLYRITALKKQLQSHENKNTP